MLKFHYSVLLAAVAASAAVATSTMGAVMVQSLPLKSAFEAKHTLSIPVTPKVGEAGIEFPALKAQPGQTLCLKFRAYLYTEQPAGWNAYLQLRLNGKAVTGYLSDGTQRLLNRGDVLKTTIEGSKNWWQTGNEANDTLETLFGPGTGDIDARVKSSRDEGYWYVLNISDLANYIVVGADDRIESAKPNKLVFRNIYMAGDNAICKSMRIEDISVGYVPTESVEKLLPETNKPRTNLKGDMLQAVGSSLMISKTGAMQLKIGKDSYFFDSAFSYPGEKIRYHEFSANPKADAAWEVSSARGKSGVLTVTGEAAGYRVIRTVKSSGGKYSVTDTIENKTDAPLGVGIRHEITTFQKLRSGDVYLVGNKDCPGTDACAVNPTVFMRQPASSLGVVVEDDVLRLQLNMLTKGDTATFGTDHFGLDAHRKYTTEWTIYPSTDRDYWAFINRVRRDWKVNVTIPGPFAFSEGEFLPERKVKIYSIPPWFEYASGSGTSKEDFVKILKPKISSLLAAQPDALPIGMLECNLVAVDRTKLPDSDKIPIIDQSPDRRGTYGQECNAEQTKVFKRLPWFDCMLKTADGRAFVDTYYANSNFIDLMVYPAPGNHQFQYLRDNADFLMDKVGFKGVYIDQFTLAVRGLGQRDRCDFSKWDGHTIDLNERGEISRKYTDAALVGARARADIIKHVTAKGGIVVTNGHSVVRETTGLPCFNFQETEWTAFNPIEGMQAEPPIEGDMAAGHLDTPMGLGIRPSRFGKEGDEHFAEIIHKWVITCLKNGQLYCYYANKIPTTGPGAGGYGILNHMYPFTPVELHPGWLIGKERILTAKSGKFVWSHPDKPVCLVFNLKGFPVTPNVKMTRKGKSWIVDLKLSDWIETAVIESAGDKH